VFKAFSYGYFSMVCSTLVGDIAEVKAIKKAFPNTSHIKMNATKSLIGHGLGAAAGLEAIVTVMAIQTGWLHPTLNQGTLIEEVAGIDTVPNVKKEHKVMKLKDVEHVDA
jgi:3-oxoacyl-[acyl-carrier-protein] synthase II